MMKKYIFGLVGRNISYSFSKKYFTEKFDTLKLNSYFYENFDIKFIEEFPSLLKVNKSELVGLNVTIPYKQEIFKYLDEIESVAKEIGAVNTIKILDNGKLKGFNTDTYGFEESLKPLLGNHIKKALILGTGGASKAVAFVLDKLKVDYKFVSRNAKNNDTIFYDQITKDVLSTYHLIINCTPIGTFPNIDTSPDVPYHWLTSRHLLYDLIYNPAESLFLTKGKERGTLIKNGKQMLELQADKAWEIWTDNSI